MTPMLPSERVAGFVAHLRRSGYRIGPAEAEATFGFLAGGADAIAARLGMKALLTGSREQWEGFDELFDAYWHGRGLHRVVPANDASIDMRALKPPPVWDRVLPSQQDRSTDVPQAQLTEGDAPTSQRDGAGRLIASRRLQRRANIIVDVAGYKSRRSQRLRQLALRMADQAVKQARTVTLEPMPPNERRIVHLALRNRTDVYTKSTGEGEARKVTIVPKSHDRVRS